MVIPTNEELVVAREAKRFLEKADAASLLPATSHHAAIAIASRHSTISIIVTSLVNPQPSTQHKCMTHQAIGLIETRGLVALVEGTDAMLKAANVELAGPMTQVGNALVTAVVVGDVAAVKAATDAGAQAIKAIKGELVSVHVIARPHADVEVVLPKKPVAK